MPTVSQREKLRDEGDGYAQLADQLASDGRSDKALVYALNALRLEIRAGAER